MFWIFVISMSTQIYALLAEMTHTAIPKRTPQPRSGAPMRVGVFGTGDVGKTLGSALIALGHEVMMGAREAQNEKAVAWAASQGERASVGTFADAAAFGELVILATLGAANPAVLAAAGAENLAGKVLIDTTNPLDFSQGFPPTLALAGQDSGGEQAQRLAPGARVV